MRWSVFAIFAFVFLVLEVSLQKVLVLGPLGNVAPSFVFILVVFLGLFAPRATAIWSAWILGLLVDLCIDLPHGQEAVGPLIGVHALGYAFGCSLLIQVRAMLFRRRILTIAVMCVLGFIASSLLIGFIFTVQGWYPQDHRALVWADMRPAGELARRVGSGLYTGLVALLLGRVLVWTLPAWAFRSAGPGRDARR